MPPNPSHSRIPPTGDLDSAVRLCLEKLGALGQAAALARKSHSIPAAALVARAALASSEVQLAIEFLLLAGQLDQAFDLAAAKGQLAAFGQLAASSIKVSFVGLLLLSAQPTNPQHNCWFANVFLCPLCVKVMPLRDKVCHEP